MFFLEYRLTLCARLKPFLRKPTIGALLVRLSHAPISYRSA
jgi:hypothetical protein